MDDLRKWYNKIHQRPGSDNWYRNYTWGSQRYRESLKTSNRDEAAGIVRDEIEGFKLKARQAALIRDGVIQPEQVKRRPELTLAEACKRFEDERPKPTSMPNIKGYHKVLVALLGANTLLSSIDTAMAAAMVLVLEKETVKYRDGERPMAESTINHHLQHLRTLMRRAQRKWGVSCDYLSVLWTGDNEGDGVLLAEPDFERTTIADQDEYERVVAALDPDARAVFEFASEIGVRAANAWGLRWPQVKWDDATMTSGTLTFAVKSRKRNRRTGKSGKTKVYPITPRIADILRAAWSLAVDRHGPVFMFTARQGYGISKYPKGHPRRRDEGDRLPFTQATLSDRWEEARAKIGSKMRWHDATRASFATRLHEDGVNPVDIQQAMGHADLSTTLRYINVKTERTHSVILAAAQRRLAQNRHTVAPKAPEAAD